VKNKTYGQGPALTYVAADIVKEEGGELRIRDTEICKRGPPNRDWGTESKKVGQT